MTYAVLIRGFLFERLLFMNFKSIESLEKAVLQRTALHIGVDLVTMTPWSVDALRARLGGCHVLTPMRTGFDMAPGTTGSAARRSWR